MPWSLSSPPRFGDNGRRSWRRRPGRPTFAPRTCFLRGGSGLSRPPEQVVDSELLRTLRWTDHLGTDDRPSSGSALFRSRERAQRAR
ncbi:hypothetical protein MRX96_003772 [Rhipicephalus microplus]